MLVRMLLWQVHKFSYIVFPKAPSFIRCLPSSWDCLVLLSSIKSQQCSSDPVLLPRMLSSKPDLWPESQRHPSLLQKTEEERDSDWWWGPGHISSPSEFQFSYLTWAHGRFETMKWKWFCIHYFSCYDQILARALKGGRFILAHSLKGYSLSQRGRYGGRLLDSTTPSSSQAGTFHFLEFYPAWKELSYSRDTVPLFDCQTIETMDPKKM